jgi:hypothetical protein
MNKNLIYIVVMLGAFTLSSCKDYLTEVSETSFTTASLFETAEGIDKMAESIYPYERGLARKGNANGFLASHIWGERTTDLSLFTTGDDANICRYTSPGPTSNIRGLLYSPFWTHRYYIIGRANEIIHYGEKLGDDTKRSVGEAHFWRAYSYYGLWSRFSRVYLSTEPVTKENMEQLQYTPADSVDVFRLMLADADKAIAALPIADKGDGRLTQDAARHLKALIAAWAKDWPEVLVQVKGIEDNNAHSLVSDPKTIFDRKDFYNLSESLFSLNYSMERGGGEGHRLGSQYINIISETNFTHKMINGVLTQNTEENLGRQWGLAYPNSYLMSLYPAGDKRLSAYYKIDYTYQNPNRIITIPVSQTLTDAQTGRTYTTTRNTSGAPRQIAIGDIIYGRDIFAATGSKIDRRNLLPSSIKMYDRWDKPLNADGPNSFKDVMIYRLAESFLLGAEAAVKLNNQDRAKYYFNKTWVRAGNTAITTDITFDMVKDEHARELAFEGRRWDFLKRNGIWYSQMIKYAGDFTKYPAAAVPYNPASYGNGDGRDPAFRPNPNYYIDFNGSDNDILVRFNVKPIHVRWPIPQDQIDAMGPQNFPQTDGY